MNEIKTIQTINYFRNIDMFGVGFIPTLFSQKRYKTICGAVLTLILAILSLYKLIIILTDAIYKTNFSVTEEKDILNGEDQIISSFYLTVCVDKLNNDVLVFDDMQSREIKISPSYNQIFSKLNDESCYTYNLTNLIISSDPKSKNHNIKTKIYKKK